MNTGYNCQVCKNYHPFSMYLMAHSRERLVHQCEFCGSRHELLNGVATLIYRDPSGIVLTDWFYSDDPVHCGYYQIMFTNFKESEREQWWWDGQRFTFGEDGIPISRNAVKAWRGILQ